MYRYVYCITRKLHKPLINVVGIANAAVHALQYNEIAAIVSEVATVKTPISDENILRHAVVIDAIQREQTVLPMRFSSVFEGDAEALEYLKNRYAVFVSDLERLHDTWEMGLRVVTRRNNMQNKGNENPLTSPFNKPGGLCNLLLFGEGDFIIPPLEKGGKGGFSDEKGNSRPGTSYLEQRRAHYEFLDESDALVQGMVRTCHAQFKGLYAECRSDASNSFLQGISLNYLIHKDCMPDFKARFYALNTSSKKELQFVCSGPWPPYHFISSGNNA